MTRGWPAIAALVGAAAAGVGACGGNPAPAGSPGPLRGYEIIVRGRDSLSQALSRAFARAGFTVRDDVRGGGRPAAALVYWHFVDPEGRDALEAQLADTRRGTVLATAVIPRDTLPADLAGRADLLLHALLHPSP